MGLLSRFVRPAPEHDTVDAGEVELRNTTAGSVTADKVMMSRSSARTVSAADDIMMQLSAALKVDAGGDAIISGGASPLVIAGRDARLERGAVGLLSAEKARAESSIIGVLLAREAELAEGTRVFVSNREALLIVLGIAVLLPVVGALLRRLLPPSAPRDYSNQPVYVRIGLNIFAFMLRIGLIALTIWLVVRWARGKIYQAVPAFVRSK